MIGLERGDLVFFVVMGLWVFFTVYLLLRVSSLVSFMAGVLFGGLVVFWGLMVLGAFLGGEEYW